MSQSPNLAFFVQSNATTHRLMSYHGGSCGHLTPSRSHSPLYLEVKFDHLTVLSNIRLFLSSLGSTLVTDNFLGEPQSMHNQQHFRPTSILRGVGACIGICSVASWNASPGSIELALAVQQRDACRSLRGFPSLAAFMSSKANCESFIYKRFDCLAARNLLHLQSELASLEGKLQEGDEVDHDEVGARGREARNCARSWEDFERIQERDPEQRKRWDLHQRIRKTLREYRKYFPSLDICSDLVQRKRR